MKDPLAAFLRHLAVERNASGHTLRSYRTDLDEFQRFVAQREGAGLAATDPRAVRAWLAALHARGLQPASVGRKLAALRSCLRFLVRRGVISTNPAREVRGPRQPRKLVSFLPIDEATDLVDARAIGGASRVRDVAILELLYATGVRVSELSRAGRGRARSHRADGARPRQGPQGAHRALRRQGGTRARDMARAPRRAFRAGVHEHDAAGGWACAPCTRSSGARPARLVLSGG